MKLINVSSKPALVASVRGAPCSLMDVSTRSATIDSPEADHASRQEQIVSAAKFLFAQRGYHGTSMKDIADRLGIKAPSLYNYIDSKQTLLREIMMETMETLIEAQKAAVSTTRDPAEQLRRSMESHVRYHARHQRETLIGNAEIASLEQPHRRKLLEARHQYSNAWEELIGNGVEKGAFEARSVSLAVYAMLEMGIGVALWFREDGPLSESEVAYIYGDMALKLVTPAA